MEYLSAKCRRRIEIGDKEQQLQTHTKNVIFMSVYTLATKSNCTIYLVNFTSLILYVFEMGHWHSSHLTQIDSFTHCDKQIFEYKQSKAKDRSVSFSQNLLATFRICTVTNRFNLCKTASANQNQHSFFFYLYYLMSICSQFDTR